MGILSRFKEIMASNINAFFEKSEDPEKATDELMRKVYSDLGQVKAETASIVAEESRAKRALDECRDEIRKLQRYAEKSAEAGDEEGARKFLDKKAALEEKEAKLQAAYETASSNVTSMKQIQDKLVADFGRLEERRSKLKEKIAATKAQQSLNALGSPSGGKEGLFDALEEKVNRAYDEAAAIAELRADSKDDFDKMFEEKMKKKE